MNILSINARGFSWSVAILLHIVTLYPDCVSAEPATYLLTEIQHTEKFLLDHIKFRNVDTGDDVILEGEYRGKRSLKSANLRDKLILIKVPPGRYYLRVLVNAWHGAFRFSKPEKLIEIEADRINYIGDIIILAHDDRLETNVRYNYEYSDATVDLALRRNKDIFAVTDIVLSLPGEIPIQLNTGPSEDDEKEPTEQSNQSVQPDQPSAGR